MCNKLSNLCLFFDRESTLGRINILSTNCFYISSDYSISSLKKIQYWNRSAFVLLFNICNFTKYCNTHVSINIGFATFVNFSNLFAKMPKFRNYKFSFKGSWQKGNTFRYGPEKLIFVLILNIKTLKVPREIKIHFNRI